MLKRLAGIFAAFICLSNISAQAAEPIEVHVGMTSVQPPFVMDQESNTGLAFDLINALNDLQDQYHFDGSLYPTKRMLETYEALQMHVIAFNDVNWGWQQRGGRGSLTLTDGMDVFFQLKKPLPQNRPGTIGAVRGFHYAFANYDPSKLMRMSNVNLVKDEIHVHKMVKNGRVDTGITSLAFLHWLSISNPESYAQITIQERPDNHYNRQMVVLPKSPVSLETMNSLLLTLQQKGTLSLLFSKYGLPTPPLEEAARPER